MKLWARIRFSIFFETCTNYILWVTSFVPLAFITVLRSLKSEIKNFKTEVRGKREKSWGALWTLLWRISWHSSVTVSWKVKLQSFQRFSFFSTFFIFFSEELPRQLESTSYFVLIIMNNFSIAFKFQNTLFWYYTL